MYYITRKQRLNNVDYFRYLNTNTEKWSDFIEKAKGYKSFNNAQDMLKKIIIVYRDYYRLSSIDLWSDIVKNNEFQLSYFDDTRSIHNLKLDFTIK